MENDASGRETSPDNMNHFTLDFRDYNRLQRERKKIERKKTLMRTQRWW